MFMILSEQRRNDIPFGGKFKQAKEVIAALPVVAPARINIRKLSAGSWFHRKILEGEGLGGIQLRLRIWIGLIAIIHALADVHAVCSKSDIKRLGARTHRK